MRPAAGIALASFLAAGAAFAKQEQVKPERPTIEAQRKEPALRLDCRPFTIEWWVRGPDGRLKLAGTQVITRCD
jgi:hypothetical protein